MKQHSGIFIHFRYAFSAAALFHCVTVKKIASDYSNSQMLSKIIYIF